MYRKFKLASAVILSLNSSLNNFNKCFWVRSFSAGVEPWMTARPSSRYIDLRCTCQL